MMGSENAVRQAGSRGMNEVNMIRTGDLIRAVGSVADGEKTAEKYAAHLRELFDALREEAIGGDFSEALARGDAEKAVRSCAAHFRAGPDDALPVAAQFRFDRNTAERAVRGAVRVIGIDWEFPDGRIDYLFDPTALRGARNHEWLWQLNRHAFWLHMAEAYRESGNEACASAFERQLLDWIAQTDCPREAWNAPGSAWRTIECGIRLMGSWPIALRVFRHASAFSDVSLLLMLASMRRQALHLLAHPTRANWLMMECCGVFTFAALYPEFREAEAFAKTACARFFAEMEAQILPDGMHNELSPDYQSVVWNCAANLYEIAREKKRNPRCRPVSCGRCRKPSARRCCFRRPPSRSRGPTTVIPYRRRISLCGLQNCCRRRTNMISSIPGAPRDGRRKGKPLPLFCLGPVSASCVPGGTGTRRISALT